MALTINAYRGDSGYFERTYRHVVAQLAYPFAERRIAVDRSVLTGRFAGTTGQDELDAQLDRLAADGLVDVVEDVDWSPAAVDVVMEKYFGRSDVEPRCDGGTSVYQYLWALDQCSSRYVLHLDSDILMHLADGRRWIDDAIELMEKTPSVVVATPEGGAPMAESLADWIRGRRGRDVTPRWDRAAGTSTRYFLVDHQRFLDEACPLDLRPGERLEETLTTTFANRGLERRSLVDDRNYLVHPRRHNEPYLSSLDSLIAVVEADRCPYRRTGNRWDMRTEGRHFLPWKVATLTLQAQRRLRRARSRSIS